MRKHAKPGEGLLSPWLHKKLEDFLFTRNTQLTIYIFSVSFLYAVFSDAGLRSFILNEDERFGTNAVIVLFLFILLLIFYIGLVLSRKTISKIGKLAGYTIAGLAPLLIGIEYFLEVLGESMVNDTLLLALALYYLFVGLISFLSNARSHQTGYGRYRSDFTKSYSSTALWFATILALGTSITMLTLFSEQNHSWAYVATLNSIIWSLMVETFLFQDHPKIIE